jgi:hypothetical protein
MPRFELDSISLDGKDFQIINKSVKLRLVTQAEAFAYKRQPRGGAVKISNNDVKAIQEALAASNNNRLTTSIVNTNETNGNFIHSDNIASFTGRIFSTSKVGKSLSSQAITKYLQKSFNKLSRRASTSYLDDLSTTRIRSTKNQSTPAHRQRHQTLIQNQARLPRPLLITVVVEAIEHSC